MLHGCSELPSTVPRTNIDYRDYLERTYELIEYSGSGENGVVLAMRGDIAIKIMPYSKKTEYEVEVACKLNQLAEYTKCFINTIGWFGCRKIPNLWKNFTGPQDYYLCMVMEEVDGPIDSFELTESDIFGILFDLLNAIYIARKLFKYSHNDIHVKNIMVNKRRRFTPKLIDQGNASFGIDRKSHDLLEIEQMIYEIWDVEEDGPIRQFFLRPEWQKGVISQSSNYQIIADILSCALCQEKAQLVELGGINHFCKPICQEVFYLIGGRQKFEETTITDLTRIRDVWKKVSDNYDIEQVLLLRRINNRFKDIVDDEGFIAYYIGNHTDEMRRIFYRSRNQNTEFMSKWIRVAIPILPDQHLFYFTWACTFGYIDIAQMITIDPPPIEALRRAASGGHTEIVRWLVTKRGVDPTDRVLEFAIGGSHVETIRYLLKHINPTIHDLSLAFNSEMAELFYNDAITFKFAIANEFVPLLRVLMKRRDPSENNNYALRLAIGQIKSPGPIEKRRTMVRMLLSDPKVRANLSEREIAEYDKI
jgi:hypothetical protein